MPQWVRKMSAQSSTAIWSTLARTVQFSEMGPNAARSACVPAESTS